LNLSLLALAEGDDQSIPFNTQFFHDDFDDGDGPGFDDGDEGGGIGSAPMADGDEPDLMATLAGSSRRVRPQFVNYAKKAKRVDVRKLKENIWKGLDIKIPNLKDPDESMVRFWTSLFVPPNE
jgi:condensin complex subunit 2